MPIEFSCAQCGQLLRVPDDSAGKQAKCPKCEAIVPVPATSGQGDPPPPVGGQADDPLSAGGQVSAGEQASGTPTDPSAQSGGPWGASGTPGESGAAAGGGGAPGFEGFAGLGAGAGAGAGGARPGENPFAESPPASANPYSPPTAAYNKPAAKEVSQNVVPTAVEAGDVISHAWEVWKDNLGLLVGVFVFIAVVSWLFSGLQSGIQVAMQQADFTEEAAALTTAPIGFIANFVQIFLGIGQARIGLRLARGQRAEFSDVFSGGPMFLPVLGGSILFGLAIGVGVLLLIIPGIIVAVLFWPFYFLLVEQKTGVFESFSVSYEIAKQNVGTTLVLFFAGFGIVLLGLLACFVGLFLAVPLSQMLWVVGYLMMSGQLSSRPGQTASGYAY